MSEVGLQGDGGDVLNDEIEELQEQIAEVIPPNKRIAIIDLLNPDHEYECIAVVDDVNLAQHIVHEITPRLSKVKKGTVDTTKLDMTAGEKIEFLTKVLCVCEKIE